MAIVLFQAEVWTRQDPLQSIVLRFYMDIPTCAALPSLKLTGMVCECKRFEMHACFHKLVFNIRFSHHKVSKYVFQQNSVPVLF